MKTLLLSVLVLCMAFCIGCGSLIKDLKLTTNIAINHAKVEWQIEMNNCLEEQQEECKKAEKIGEWIDYGNRFLVYLESPDFNSDVALGVLDAVIKEIEQSENKQLLVYAYDIRTILQVIKEEN